MSWLAIFSFSSRTSYGGALLGEERGLEGRNLLFPCDRGEKHFAKVVVLENPRLRRRDEEASQRCARTLNPAFRASETLVPDIPHTKRMFRHGFAHRCLNATRVLMNLKIISLLPVARVDVRVLRTPRPWAMFHGRAPTPRRRRSPNPLPPFHSQNTSSCWRSRASSHSARVD